MGAEIDFGALLKAIRRARGLTQEQLARELDVTFGTVNGWENRKHQPIRALARRIVSVAADAGVAPRRTSTRTGGRSPRRGRA